MPFGEKPRVQAGVLSRGHGKEAFHRTIADLDDLAEITSDHLNEAINDRARERTDWQGQQ